MRNVAKAGALLFLIVLVMGVAYVGSEVEAVTAKAIDSQESINIAAEIAAGNIEKHNFKVETETAAGSPVRSFKATAYCLRGKTASGRYVRRGIVAADPRVLPLGTRIHMSGGRYTGNYLVADTGGKIKGRILDIWVPSCNEARRWGRRTVKVKVVSKPKKRGRKK